MVAPTGVAAVNVDGATIHSALALSPKPNYSKGMPKLSDKKKMHVTKQILTVFSDYH